MKNCLILSSSPDIFGYPEEYSHEESVLHQHLRARLLEVYGNACTFSLGLRNLCEIRMGELLVNMRSNYEYTDITHIFPRQGYHNCRTRDEYDELIHVSECCDHHFLLSSAPAPDVTQTFCDFCENHAGIVLLVSPSERIDPETEAIVNTAARTCKPILRLDPVTFEFRRENLPPHWMTYEEWVRREYRHYTNVAARPNIVRNQKPSRRKPK